MRRAEDVDWLTTIVAIAFGLLIWNSDASRPGALGWFLGDLAIGGVALALLPELRKAHSQSLQFLGVTLPGFAFLFIGREAGAVIAASTIQWHDTALATIDQWIFAERVLVVPPLVRDWLTFSYLIFVPLLVGGVALLFPLDPRDPSAAAERTVRRLCLALTVCCFCYIAYPVRGPRWVNPALHAELLGRGTWSIIAHAYEGAMIRGAAFPSAHVAATFIVMAGLYEKRPCAFWAYLPVAASLAIGAVYLAYHYFTDVIAGIAVGVAAIALDRAWLSRRRQR